LKLTYRGRTQTVAEWAEEIGVSRSTVYCRIRRGNSIQQVLSPGSLPQPPQGRIITFRGETKSLRQWAESIGISVQALKQRLTNWTKKDALTRPNTWG
jgi:DNA-binding Lrp family transcriptional regulator